MKESIENIWIINFEGECYFYKKCDPESTLDEDSFSSFIQAMMFFTRDVFGDQLHKLSLGNMEVIMQSFKIFRIFVSCKKGTNEKKVIKTINEIGKVFNEKYGQLLTNDFEKTTFEEFNEVLLSILK